jgi:hypothetical protein
VIPGKFVLIIAYQCRLMAKATEFKISEEHEEVRLFSVSELGKIPIPKLYAKAIMLATALLPKDP